MEIKEIKATKAVDSANGTTVNIEVITNSSRASSSAPSGRTKAKYEAPFFSTRGLDESIKLVKKLNEKISGMHFTSWDSLEEVEEEAKKIDKSERWHNLGVATIFSLEAALLKALAMSEQTEVWKYLNPSTKNLPSLYVGSIAGGLQSNLSVKPDFQEFLISPDTKKFFDSYFISMQAYKTVKHLLPKEEQIQQQLSAKNALLTSLSNEEVLELLKKVKEEIKEKFDTTLRIGVDMEASSFFFDSSYLYRNHSKGKGKRIDKMDQVQNVFDLIKKYELAYIEDPFHEEEFGAFSRLLRIMKQYKTQSMIVADDLVAGDLDRLKRAIKEKAANSINLKANCTILEMKKLLDEARKHDLKCVMSHRTYETSDDIISQLAIAWQIPFIRLSVVGSERTVKINKLIRAERELAGVK